MKKGYLICFIGIDGSGKTTQAKELVKELSKLGIKSKYVWNRFEPFLSYPIVWLARKIFFRKMNPFLDYESYLSTKRKLFRKHLLSFLYIKILLIDYFFQILFRINIPLNSGISIICDRYVYDTMVDLMVDSGYSIKQLEKMLKKYMRLIPTPDFVIFIDIPEEVAFRRKNDIPSLDYLVSRRNGYFAIIDLVNKTDDIKVIRVDGCKDIEELKKEIQRKVTDLIRRGGR